MGLLMPDQILHSRSEILRCDITYFNIKFFYVIYCSNFSNSQISQFLAKKKSTCPPENQLVFGRKVFTEYSKHKSEIFHPSVV